MSAVTPQAGVDEVHILWTSEGMSCDGDTVSVTAARLPSIEEVLLGLVPGLPKVHLHNKVLAPEAGADFMAAFHRAAEGELGPFIFVVEGSIPNENINGEGLLDVDGQRSGDGSADHGERVDRPAGAEGVGGGGDRHLRDVRRHSCHGGQSDGLHGAGGLPRAGTSARRGGLPIVNVPGCPVQPDNFMETLTWLLYQVAGLAPMIPLDEQLRPTWLFGKTVHEGCDRAGYYEQGDFARDYNSPKCQVQDRLLGAGGELQRHQARLDGRYRRLPECGRDLHRLHDAWFPGQVHAVHG